MSNYCRWPECKCDEQQACPPMLRIGKGDRHYMAHDLLSIASNQIEFSDPTQVPEGQRAFVEWHNTFTPEMVLVLVEFYESFELDEHCELCGGPQRDGQHTERCVVTRIRKLSEGGNGDG